MKATLLSTVLLCGSFLGAHCQNVTIPDANFKAALIAAGVDKNKDNQIQVSEAEVVKTLNVSNKSIADMTGIEAFTALTFLSCYKNPFTTLDVSMNTMLASLTCYLNQLTTLNVSMLSGLNELYVDSSPNLRVICLNAIQYTKANLDPDAWHKDATASWSTTCVTGLENEKVSTPKKVLKVYTLTGHEIDESQANGGVYLYLFSDGTRQKVVKP